ncbi:Fic family protein [Streptomyces iakyrus]
MAESARDAAPPLPLTARAARVYLDVCFFHPFDDGNARAAFLTLVFVLAREGIALDRVSPSSESCSLSVVIGRYSGHGGVMGCRSAPWREGAEDDRRRLPVPA